ncbi:MAG TPA: PAS domain S-box protein [Burkholderiales bacterium]|nr:PAS domain S-box protein [Burkholderiales bacterium]
MNQHKEHVGRRLSSDVFRLALDVSADLIYIVDAVTARIVEINQTICQELGYSRDELLNMHGYEITTAEPLVAKRRLAHLVATRPRSKSSNMVLRRKDGTVLTVEVNRRAVMIRKQPYMIAIARDITNRLRAEEALRKSEERFALFMKHMPGPVFIKDDKGRYIYANPTCALSQRVGPDEWAGKTDEELFPAETAQQFRTNDSNALQGGTPMHGIETVEWPDETRYYIVSRFPIPDSGGPPLLGGAALDITELKRTEEALRHSEQQLRIVIEDRERLARDLHDNIVQSIFAIGMTLEHERGVVREQPEHVASTLADAIDRLNGVIAQVRGYIEASHGHAVSSQDLTSRLLSLVRAFEAAGKPQFKFDVDPLALAHLAPHETEHVLQIAREALSNAARHAHAQSATLTIRRRDGGVEVEVADDGAGFDPIQAGSQGHGLSNMHTRARQMGAQLVVHAIPGAGTRVHLYISPSAERDVVA